MNKLCLLVVLGMLIAVIGLAQLGADARLPAVGFALCIGVLVHWVNSLQKQVDALTSAGNECS